MQKNKTLKETVESMRRVAQNAVLIFCVDYIQDEQLKEQILASGVDGIVLRPFFLSNLEMTIARTKTDMVSGKEIPIIAMTANAFSEDVQHCIGAGMDAHIAKPLDIAVLEKTICGFLVRKK